MRAASTTRGTLRRLTEALEMDHRRLDVLKVEAFEALRAGDREGARRSFSAFQHGLERHMRFEERLVFPVFEMRGRLPHGGPTSVLLAEHRQISALVHEIAQVLASGGSAIEERRKTLDDALADHQRKEETIFYPWTDRLLSDGESDKLVAQIQAFAG
jgi:iron-sulfur cluster repair protein YtfE (RIC family)